MTTKDHKKAQGGSAAPLAAAPQADPPGAALQADPSAVPPQADPPPATSQTDPPGAALQADPPAARPTYAALRVSAVGQPQRCRCGRRFGPQAAEIPATEITEDEFDALRADPFLKVELVAG